MIDKASNKKFRACSVLIIDRNKREENSNIDY